MSVRSQARDWVTPERLEACKFFYRGADASEMLKHLATYTDKDFDVLALYSTKVAEHLEPLGDLRVGIAKGDNWKGAARTLMGAGYVLKSPSGRVMTGNEKKKTGEQPLCATTQAGDVFFIFPPQDFPERLRDGDIDMVVGAGYDIQVNYAMVPNLNLNGEMANPETRIEAMRKELERSECGIPLVHLGYSPVVSVLMTRRDGGLRQLGEMRKRRANTGLSEYPHILDQYGRYAEVPFNRIKKATGGAETQLMAGFADVASDVVQTGGSLIGAIGGIRLIRGDNGKVVRVNYSDAWALASPHAMADAGKKDRIDMFAKRLGTGVATARALEPDLFMPLYEDGLQEYEIAETRIGDA